jgi:hypothetical protein
MRAKTLVTGRMKASPSKSIMTGVWKKRSRDETSDVGQSSASPSSTRPNPSREWTKAELKSEDLLALVSSDF